MLKKTKQFLLILMILSVSFVTVNTTFAQEVDGVWLVNGANPEGTTYEGKLSIAAVNERLHLLFWDIKYNGNEQNDYFPGTGIYYPEKNSMFVAYGIETLRYGLVVYGINSNGGLETDGLWTSGNGVGAERLSGGPSNSIAGTYQVDGSRPEGDVQGGASATYSGTLIIEEADGFYLLTWDLGDGNPYNGIAFPNGDNTELVGAWGIGGDYGVEIYQFNGDTAEAIWASPSYGDGSGTENLTRMD